LKTVADIAKEIGVSKQAVWKRIKGSLSTSLQQFISTVDGTVYIEVDGVNLIKQAFNKKSANEDATTDTATIDDKLTGMLSDTIAIMKEQLLGKDQQLSEKDKQITELHRLLDQQQQLHLMEQKNMLQLTDNKKSSLWDRLRSKDKKSQE